MSTNNKIAVDVGHGFTKALSSTGQRVLFPSLITSAPSALDLGDFARADIILIDGQPYLVGDPARAHTTPLWSRAKATDPGTMRLILVSAAMLGATGPVELATGLPLSWFGSQRRGFKDALIGYGGVVQLPAQPPQRLWFESVRVLPQGLAAAVVVLADATYHPGPYVVVDVGYRTTEYLVVSKDPTGKLAYDATQAGSIETGTHAITTAMGATLEREYHLEFKPAEIESTETVFIRGQAVSLATSRRQASATVATQLRDQLTEILDDHLLKAAGIVLVGGGSGLLEDAFAGAVVVPNGQWSNAQAYLS